MELHTILGDIRKADQDYHLIDDGDRIAVGVSGGKDSATPFKYPISCKIVNDQLILSIDIKVKYSVNVNEESSKVQSKIFENIEHMTGYTPDIIDIHVVGFIF